METYEVIVRFFQQGGIFMYPILFVFAIGVAIALERYLFLSMMRLGNKKLWNKMQPLLSTGELEEAGEISTSSKAVISKILNNGIQRAKQSSKPEEIESAMEEGILEIIPRLEKRTHYLATFANIATLMGLLGTIIGLIQAFNSVANAAPAEKAVQLSSSISIAMNTTAFGLMAAIPLLLIYAVLNTKTNELIDSLDMVAIKFLNLVTTKVEE